MEDVKLLDYKFDIDGLKEALDYTLTLTGWEPHHSQIALTHLPGSDDVWFEGTGSLHYKFGTQNFDENGELIKRETHLDTSEFTEFNSALDDTYLRVVYDTIKADYKLGRVRLMALPHKKCMSIHRDAQPRIHVPIITNKNCRMMIDDNVYHLKADGSAYWTNTLKPHTAFNADHSELRIHMLFDLVI